MTKLKQKKYMWIFIPLIISSIIIVVIKLKAYSQPITYTNSKLGISMTFPEDWAGKYEIEERKNSIYVYFDPTFSLGHGLLFAIAEQGPDAETYDDTIGPQKYLEIKGKTYQIGSTTDIGFDPDSNAYSTYTKMRKESSDVLKTLKVID